MDGLILKLRECSESLQNLETTVWRENFVRWKGGGRGGRGGGEGEGERVCIYL